MRQNISMKRAQSRGHSGFARVMTIVALLLTAATGAWAQEPATTYSVKMKDGTVDAKNWSIASGEKSAKGDAADGLTGLSEGDQVTLQYNGRLKVKGVKATSDAAAASVPDGAISGVFSVSSSKKVYFSKGNLRYASSKWSFFDNQYDYYTSQSADAWDKFGWSTSATTYGMHTSDYNSAYSGDFVDWGATMGTGWFTLSSDDWTYLLKTRSASTVNGTENGRYAKAQVNDVGGFIIFPDTYTHPDGVAAPTGVNSTLNTGWNGNSYTVADWTKMESAGCVFLPAAGYREGSLVSEQGTYGNYWSATPNGANSANRLSFTSGDVNPAGNFGRSNGCSVRLVREVATSDPAPAAVSLIVNPVVGQIIGSDGKNYDANATLPTGVTAVAKICYVGSDNGEAAPYNHGLALALSDVSSSTYTWCSQTSATCLASGHQFDSEDGAKGDLAGIANTDALVSNTGHTHAAASAARNYNSGTHPTGTSAWFLPSAGQWDKMATAAGGYGNLKTNAGLQSYIYWSSTEVKADRAWSTDFSDNGYWGKDHKDYEDRVRPCLAF